MMWHEAGAAAANSGVQFTAIGTRRPLHRRRVPRRGQAARPYRAAADRARRDREHAQSWAAASSSRRARRSRSARAAREPGIARYLDGARLFNASVASGASLAELAQPFDLVSVALSKGLGCPVGSVLAGSKALIAQAVTARRRFGGAMRQSGILAAAGLYALDHNVARLADDHANARIIAERIAGLAGVRLDLATVQTNIVIWDMADDAPDAATIVASGESSAAC